MEGDRTRVAATIQPAISPRMRRTSSAMIADAIAGR
jgi:hypothetical protein